MTSDDEQSKILDRVGDPWKERDAGLTQRVIDSRFRLINQIGYGTFGKVYAAVDTFTGDQVAIKLFNSNFQKSGYLQELGLLFDKDHRFIVNVLSFGYSEGHKYLVYEFIPGGTLRDLIAVNPRVAPSLALQIAHQIATGLQFAHRHQVVHRDLKPENILLTAPQWPFEVKLCDFGLAARCRNQSGLVSAFGSTAYMAPEQFDKGYDSRVDIYALGVILYEMLFGRRPYTGDASAITYAHRHNPIAFPPQVDEGLTQLLRKSLAIDPDDRYVDCRSLLRDLDDAIAHLDGQSPSEPLPQLQSTQPQINTLWRTELPLTTSVFATTAFGRLALADDRRIYTIDPDGTFRQLFRVDQRPHLIANQGRMEEAFAWLHDDEIVIWSRDRQFHTIDVDDALKEHPMTLTFGPDGSYLAVVSPFKVMLYTLDGTQLWQAEINCYGMLPATAFSRCGTYLWLTTGSPQTQLVCLSTTGERITDLSTGHPEVTLLGLDDGKVLMAAKNQRYLSIVNPQGFIECSAETHDEIYSLSLFDNQTITVNSVSHLEWFDCRDLTSRGFINISDPFDTYFEIQGGAYQISDDMGSTQIQFLDMTIHDGRSPFEPSQASENSFQSTSSNRTSRLRTAP